MTDDEWKKGLGQRMARGASWRRWSWLLVLAVLVGPSSSRAGEASLLLTAWLNSQTNLHTWSAEVTQTRTLKTLTQPLTAKGRVWFAAPNRFRWEITHPSPTIAVRQPEQLLVIYPRLKRAERYPLTGDQADPWQDTLALLEAGFPRRPAELEARFKLIAQSVTNGICEITLQPKSASARRFLPEIKIVFTTNDLALHATELQFTDGSRLRNEFSRSQRNLPVDDSTFTPELGADFKIVEPLKK